MGGRPWGWSLLVAAIATLDAGVHRPHAVPVAALVVRATPDAVGGVPHAIPAMGVRLPVRFEANAGQWPERIRFAGRGTGGSTLLLTDEGMTFVFRGTRRRRSERDAAPQEGRTAVITMDLVGARPRAPSGEAPWIARSNYFLGNDPARWRTGVANFGRVRAEGWLPGVSVIWRGSESGIEYDLEVAAGTDASRVEIDVGGATALRVRGDGTLSIETQAGTLQQRPPRVTQSGRVLNARIRLVGPHRVGFQIDGYDPTQPVLIDPALAYSTYLGGSGIDYGYGIAVDSSGDAYVVGETDSADFPTAMPLQGDYPGGSDAAFVTKLSASGSAVLYSTYLGGLGSPNGIGTSGYGIAVDSAGSAYVVGQTSARDFPSASAAQGTYPGGLLTAFVTKLDPSGSALLYSTFLGGSVVDGASGVAVDSAGAAYVIGGTLSPDFPTVNPVQGAYGGTGSGGDSGDVFVTKLSPSGSALVYSTFLGGGGGDEGSGIAIDPAGNAYVTGTTASTNFPTAHAVQNANAGEDDAFVAELGASGSSLVYSSYLGGSLNEAAAGIAVDSAGSAYLAGWTISDDFPTIHAFQSAPDAGAPGDAGFTMGSAFVTKVSPGGSALAYSTYFGGGLDQASGIAVDRSGSAYVTGLTFSTDFPTVSPLQATLRAPNGANVFVSRFDPSGSSVLFSTYLGGDDDDRSAAIAIDSAGSAYVTGYATSFDFPTVNAVQPTIGNPSECCLSDAFLVKIAAEAVVPEDAGTPETGEPVDAEALEDARAPEDAKAPLDGGAGSLLVGGCGCRSAGSAEGPASAWGLLGLLALLGRRGRREAGCVRNVVVE